MIAAQKDETPTRRQATGVSGHQLSFFPTPVFCPILPPPHSVAEMALHDLAMEDLTQLDWIVKGKGWRLAAAVKTLEYLGWEPNSNFVKCEGWARKIKRYSLPVKAKDLLNVMSGTGANHD